MITTLTKLGEQLSDDINEWGDIIDIPKADSKKENLTARIIFDLDEQHITVEIDGQYQEKSPFTHKNIKIKDRRGKYTYACCELSNLAKIEYTFFGKVDTKGKVPTRGEFKERIDNQYPILKTTELYKIFESLFSLRSKFINEKWNDAETVNAALFGSDYKKTSNARIVLIYACIISTELGYNEPKPIYEIDGFDTYVKLDRLTKSTSADAKVSYATGLRKENVIGVEFPDRNSLNYMFVKTTLNYASQFNDNNYKKNYQVNSDEQLFLERGSRYLLKNQQIKIANISHCIIPKFLKNNSIDIDSVLKIIFKKTELLFQNNQYKSLITDIEDTINPVEVYWITFFAFETESGKSFKTINIIEDVSNLHFEKVVKSFEKVDLEFKELKYGFDWDDIMSEIRESVKKQYNFNLNSIYHIIPQRKDKEKKNEALAIFKSILEKRQLDKQVLFKHFVDLILCHRFKRYEAYKNIKRFGEDFFDFAVRDAVFKYLAFFEVLKQLKLINNMENNEISNINDVAELDNNKADQLETFFTENKLTASCKALFYLGQALNNIAYAQVLKDHPSKPILNKVNYNGMNKEDVLKLHADLSEKIIQYAEITKNGKVYNIQKWTEPILRLFRENYAVPFSDKNPKLSNYENVFYLLLGYSFRNKAKEAK